MWGSSGRGGGAHSGRRAQMDQQRQVIEKRKQQYMAKLAAASEPNSLNGSTVSTLNAFSNDGSFLDKFKKIAENKNTKKPQAKNINVKIKMGLSKLETDRKNDDKDKDSKKNNRYRSRSRSRSRERDRKYDRRNRDHNRWDSNHGTRNRSYSPCTPVVEDMPHRKSRFTNILPVYPKQILVANPIAFTGPRLPISSANPTISNIRINMPMSEKFRVPPPTVPNQIHQQMTPPPLQLQQPFSLPPTPSFMNQLFNIPVPVTLDNSLNKISYPIPLHAIPEPKPLDTISIPKPKPLDAVSIPEPEPLDTISIPPPKPMNLQAIPPPSPICLTQIPKPKELDLCSIPHPPTDNVLSTDGSLSTTLDATAKQVARNGEAWDHALKSQSSRADSLWLSEDKDYRSPVLNFDDEEVSKNSIDSVSSEDKYEPESCLRDNSSSEEEENIPEVKAPIKILIDTSKIEQKDVPLILNNPLDKSDSEEDEKIEKAKKRKSRWGDTNMSGCSGLAGVAPVVNIANTNFTPAPTLSKITRQDSGLVQYALKIYGNTNLSDEDWKKCEDHYKINILYQEMLHKRNEIERLKLAGKFKYEYDSDEEIDDSGTWEHRLRQQEMEATQRWACELTRQASGKHHIGDFLPPDELKKFMDKFSSVKTGKEPDLSDYKEFKLKEDNIGFKMLQKLGWTEGEGLGADRSGIVEPVNKGNHREITQGLGIQRVDNLAEGDDEFEAYRKRMMLAYRFRPNPLNNPRRPYY